MLFWIIFNINLKNSYKFEYLQQITGVGKVCILSDADKQLINLQPPCMVHYCEFTHYSLLMMSSVKFSLKCNIPNTAVSLSLGSSL